MATDTVSPCHELQQQLVDLQQRLELLLDLLDDF